MSMKSRITLFLLLLGVVGAAPVFAGSAAIGTVAGSLNATVSGQSLLPNSTIFSGDHLQVQNGAAVIAFANGSRMALGQNTVAQFLRDQNGVDVELASGNVSMFHPAAGTGLKVDVENWAITPGSGYRTVGEVAMVNSAVVVTAKEGMLHVQGNGKSMDVAQGKTITLTAPTKAMPQTGTSQKLVSSNVLPGLAAGLAGGGLIAAIIAAKKASDANNNAQSATSAGDAAASAADSAATAASAADSDALAAGAAANAAGCAINTWANGLGDVSPYTPPAGFTCP